MKILIIIHLFFIATLISETVSFMLNMDRISEHSNFSQSGSPEASIPDDLISGLILAIRDYEEKKTCVAFMNIVIQVKDWKR